ncbi:MAG: phospho-N-acetylmuramoyl-pentapeptide-transferase [Phycisphaeraceae bacterium]|nr:MAG: phospho-N-acetylmuramoyl-pentapeptide-transferase [Phycisphaeraceae bacterium]
MLYVLLSNIRDWLEANNLYWTMGILDQIQFRALAALLLAFFIVLVFGRRVIRLLVRLKIGDTGATDAEALRAHSQGKANTPTMGGALIVGAIAIATILLADVTKFYVQLALIVMLWTAILGGFDDWLKLTAARRGGSRQGLYAWEKLVFQLGLGLLVGFFVFNHADTAAAHDLGHVLNLPLQKTYESAQGDVSDQLIYLGRGAFIMLAVLMLTGMSNAVNITDGMDGLAGGISAAVSVGLLVLALIAGSEQASRYLLVPHIPFADELGVVAGAMIGACLGFLWWNCSPAHVFMGDTGSLALGALIGYIAIVTRQEAVVLLMSGIFLLEIASVTIQVGVFKATRMATGTGRRVFKIAPYHHALHLSGWKEQQIVARAWIVAVLLVAVALWTLKVR